MELQDDCRPQEQREVQIRRKLRDRKFERTLHEYEGFIRWKARTYARRREDLEDFEQVGREAVVKVFRTMEKGLMVRSEKGYYLNSIRNAMIDYCRKEYRPNSAVWEYDRKGAQTRVKRYRYGKEWKARVQYHGNRLGRVERYHSTSLNFEDVPQHDLCYSENFHVDG